MFCWRINSICEKKPVSNNLTFQCTPIHLKAFEHRAAYIHEDFPLKESRGNGQVTNVISGALGAVNTERYFDPTYLAAINHCEEMLQVEMLGAVEN